MQRVRIGLTGLAGVLVLVLFAAAVLGLRSSEPRARPAATAPKDPLAELGVTPGGSGADTAPSAPRPSPGAAARVQPSPARSAVRATAGTQR